MYLLTVIRFWRTKREKNFSENSRSSQAYLGGSHERHHPLQTSFDSVSDNDVRTSSRPNNRHRVRIGMFTFGRSLSHAPAGGFCRWVLHVITPSANIVSDDDVRTLVAHATLCSLRTRNYVWWVKMKGENKKIKRINNWI